MHLMQYIKRLDDLQLVSAARWATVIGSLLSGLILLLLGWMVSKLNLDNDFGYVSSFLEVMIAVDASCSFKIVGGWLKRRRHEFLAKEILIPQTLACGGLEESQMKRVEPMHQAMSALYDWIDSAVEKIGLWFAVAFTLSLVVGFKTWMRPYAVIAAYPIVAYVIAMLIANRFWECVYVRVCGILAEKSFVDPVDDTGAFDQVLGCTGPVFTTQ